jgi:hypothetical protein
VASERDHKRFYKNQSKRGLFGFEFSFQNYFGMFLAPLVRLKSFKLEMFENLQVRSQEIL